MCLSDRVMCTSQARQKRSICCRDQGQVRAMASYHTMVIAGTGSLSQSRPQNPELAARRHKPIRTTWLRNEGLLTGVDIKTNPDKSLVALNPSFLLLPYTVLLLHPTTLLDCSTWLLFCCAKPALLTARVRLSAGAAHLPAESGQMAGGNTAKNLVRLGSRRGTK